MSSWNQESIDLAEALHRVLGHKEMYKRWLESFFVPETLSEVFDAFEAQDYALAHKALHKLKGTAANLSVKKLAEQARNLDEKIKAKVSFHELEKDLSLLKACYDEAHSNYMLNASYIDEYRYPQPDITVVNGK
jgi:HPt (histidine-containing phosphotransfer) domain-containing protein